MLSDTMPPLGLGFRNVIVRAINNIDTAGGGVTLARGEIAQFDTFQDESVTTTYDIGELDSVFTSLTGPRNSGAAADAQYSLYCVALEDIEAGKRGKVQVQGVIPYARYGGVVDPGSPLSVTNSITVGGSLVASGGATAPKVVAISLSSGGSGTFGPVLFNGINGFGTRV